MFSHFLSKSHIYISLDRHDEALIEYQKAIKLDPKYADPHNNLGYLFLIRGNLSKARIHLEKVIALDPKYYLAPINLGITYILLGKKKKAKLHFQSGLEKCPISTADGCLNKITALLGLEKLQDALYLLRRSCKQFEVSPAEIEDFLKDWSLLANAPEPPAGIHEFIEQAKAMLLCETKPDE